MYSNVKIKRMHSSYMKVTALNLNVANEQKFLLHMQLYMNVICRKQMSLWRWKPSEQHHFFLLLAKDEMEFHTSNTHLHISTHTKKNCIHTLILNMIHALSLHVTSHIRLDVITITWIVHYIIVGKSFTRKFISQFSFLCFELF